ncbi:MAG TPA: TetR/AcrR family transcriptional regulator [Trebonia sp.]|jgi:AcrR family transcriptional regulator|nr:TetR/AcrR family transcriptional regulator [Trebonia sp.]
MARPGKPSKPGPRSSESSAQTREALVRAAIETLRADGFARTSARAIAGRAESNQSLIFYHFGSVANLLLAALDEVSADRLARYGATAAQAGSLTELVDVAEGIFQEDLDEGHATVLAELVSGAASVPGFGAEVAARLRSWTQFAQGAVERAAGSSALATAVPAEDVAYSLIALYLGLEMLSHLDGDRTRALALFDRAKQLAVLAEALGFAAPAKKKESS